VTESQSLWTPKYNPWAVALTVTLATFMEVLDTSIANVSLPHIASNLSASTEESTWVLTSYLVSNAIILPMSAWLQRLIGRKRFYMTCVALFTGSSFLCGMAPSLGYLILFRVLQGIGGGGLQPSEQAILADTFPPEKRGSAFSVYGMAVVVAPALGPTLGGWITDNYSWPWVFYVNIPIGALATVLTLSFIRDPKEKREIGAVDWWGIFLLILGIGSLQIVLDRGEREDWFSAPYITALSIVASVGIVAFIWRELTTEHPVVDLRVLKNRSLAVGTLFTFIYGFGMYASVFIFPVFVQNLLGFTALQTGLILLPSSLTAAVMMPVVGRLLRGGAPPRLMILLGFIVFWAFTWQLSNSTLQSGQADFFWPLILRGIGLSLLFVPFTTLALATLRGKDVHQGTGLTAMMRQLGGSFGVAIVATFIQHRAWAHREDLLRYVTPFDFAMRERLDTIVHGLMARGSALVEAQRQAYAAIDGIVTKQAYLLTYMDAFRTIGVFFICCIPLVVLFKKVRTPATVRYEFE
jgi:MFS transporter, DHA2 family, multidrug resistance protein